MTKLTTERTIKFNDWTKEFDVVLAEDACLEKRFDYAEAMAEAQKINPKTPQFHVWTRCNHDTTVIINGFRLVNSEDYCVAKKPWGSDVNGNDFIEVTLD